MADIMAGMSPGLLDYSGTKGGITAFPRTTVS